MGLLTLTNITHSFGDHTLYKEAEFKLFKGEHIGLVGKNGAGKSTLMKIMKGSIMSDEGMVRWQKGINYGYLNQFAEIDVSLTVQDYLYEVFAELFDLEKAMLDLYTKSAEGGSVDYLDQAATYQVQLESRGFYEIDSLVQQTLKGLGLLNLGLETQIADLNEGQRTKVILGKLLLIQPDVLLLDEPTNYLDEPHRKWLVTYLQQFSGAFVVISHDELFLQEISTTICDIDFGVIKKYKGSYQDFLRQKQHLVTDYTRQFEAEQKKIKETEAFIRKNIAGINTKMAQGRRKQLERMDKLEPLQVKKAIRIEFNEKINRSHQVLETMNLAVGYDQALLSEINLHLSNKSKLVVTGASGIGKTALLRTILGDIPVLKGDIKLSPQAEISYYQQVSAWRDDRLSPLQVVAEAHPKLAIEDIRKELVRVGVLSHHVDQAVSTLSGGEQAKVRLSVFALTPSNFLLLDDPTTHLDVETKRVLKEALIRYQGPVLLVSNDQGFYKEWATDIVTVS